MSKLQNVLNRIEFELLGIDEDDLTIAERNIKKHLKDYEESKE